MKRYICTAILLVCCVFSQAQTSQDKAQAFYQEAIKEFENKNYTKTLEYCQQVVSQLEKTNARVEMLRIRSYYELNQIDNAKAALQTFSNLPAEPVLKQQALSYLVKIEEREEGNRQLKIEEQRKVEAQRVAKEKQIVEARIKREKEEDTAFQNALNGSISSMRRFVLAYPNSIKKAEILQLIDSKEEDAYAVAMKSDRIPDYEFYLQQFEYGKYSNKMKDLLLSARDKKAYEQVLKSQNLAETESYLSEFPSGIYKSEVLTVLEKLLFLDGELAMKQKDYEKAQILLGRYLKTFPEGKQIKIAQGNYIQATVQVKRKEIIEGRKDNTALVINYATNGSIGLEVGGLNVSRKISMYFGINSSLNNGIYELLSDDNLATDIESIKDYKGTNVLKPIFFTSSFGLTKKITYPLWVYAGGGIRYQAYLDKDNKETYILKNPNPVTFFPEFGLQTIIVRKIVLKAGIQLLKDETVVQVGLGVAFN